MNYILEKCSFAIYDESLQQNCALFDCGNIDLNDFFVADAFLQSKQLLCKVHETQLGVSQADVSYSEIIPLKCPHYRRDEL